MGGNMDWYINKIAGFGIPGLVLLIVMGTTGFWGAAAFTVALSTMGGPLGMLGGVAVLGFLGVIASAISNYGVERIYQGVLTRLREKEGLSKNDILVKIDALPTTKSMKLKLKDFMENH